MLFFLTSCASKLPVPMASSEEDAIAKQFQTSPDRSSLYIVREERHVGHLQNIGFMIDNKVVGELENASFALVEVSPGKHVIKALGRWQNDDEIEFIVNTEKGKMYFVNMYPSMGWTKAVINYEVLDKEKGKELVVQYKRVMAR
jgi:hypothetical protein